MLTNNSILYILLIRIDKPDQDKKKPDVMIGTEHKKKRIYTFFMLKSKGHSCKASIKLRMIQ